MEGADMPPHFFKPVLRVPLWVHCSNLWLGLLDYLDL
jgi:hypothetical protein